MPMISWVQWTFNFTVNIKVFISSSSNIMTPVNNQVWPSCSKASVHPHHNNLASCLPTQRTHQLNIGPQLRSLHWLPVINSRSFTKWKRTATPVTWCKPTCRHGPYGHLMLCRWSSHTALTLCTFSVVAPSTWNYLPAECSTMPHHFCIQTSFKNPVDS